MLPASAPADVAVEPIRAPLARSPLTGCLRLTPAQFLAPWWFYQQGEFRTKLVTLRFYYAWLDLATRCPPRRAQGRGPAPLQVLCTRLGVSEKQARMALGDLEASHLCTCDIQGWRLFTDLEQLHHLPPAQTLPDLGTWLASFCRDTLYVPRLIVQALVSETARRPATMALWLALGLFPWWFHADLRKGSPDVLRHGDSTGYHLGRAWVTPTEIAGRFGVATRSIQRAFQHVQAAGCVLRLPPPPGPEGADSRQQEHHHGRQTLVILDQTPAAVRIPHVISSPASGSHMSPLSSPSSNAYPQPRRQKARVPVRLYSIGPLRGHKYSTPVQAPLAPTPLWPAVPPAPGETVPHSKGKEPLRMLAPFAEIAPEQLQDLAYLHDVLFPVAVQRGWVRATDADWLRFVTAACQARRKGRNAGGYFRVLVEGQHWHWLTQCDEDAARRHLQRDETSGPSLVTHKQTASTAHLVSKDPVLRLSRGRVAHTPAEILEMRHTPSQEAAASLPTAQESHQAQCAAGEHQWMGGAKVRFCAKCNVHESSCQCPHCVWTRDGPT